LSGKAARIDEKSDRRLSAQADRSLNECRVGSCGVLWSGLAILEASAGSSIYSVAGHFRFHSRALHTRFRWCPLRGLVLAPEGELVEQMASDPVRRAFGQGAGTGRPNSLKDGSTPFSGQGRLAHQVDLLELGNLGPSGL